MNRQNAYSYRLSIGAVVVWNLSNLLALSGYASLSWAALEVALFLALIAFRFYSIPTASRYVMTVWRLGVLSLLIGHGLAALGFITIGGIVHHLGYVWGALSVAFWLMRRFSQVRQTWADDGLLSTSVLLGLAVILQGIAQAIGLPLALAALFALMNSVAAMIWAAHSHRALSDPAPNRTLAAYWVAWGVILHLIGVGLFGSIRTFAGVNQAVMNTNLPILHTQVLQWALWAMLLGAINQTMAELRHHNRRVTGLLPYWCVVFGSLGVIIATTLQGTVVATFHYASVEVVPQAVLAVFEVGEQIGQISILGGGIVYAVGLWVRRIRATPTP